jgi:hypothetical protein
MSSESTPHAATSPAVQALVDHLLGGPTTLLDFHIVPGTGPTTEAELAQAVLDALLTPGEPITAAELDACLPAAREVDRR